MTDSNDLKIQQGQAYYSRKLNKQVMCLVPRTLGRRSAQWISINSGRGTSPEWIELHGDEEVGVDTLDPMVRGIHYEGAMETAEYLVRLGLDKIDSQVHDETNNSTDYIKSDR